MYELELPRSCDRLDSVMADLKPRDCKMNDWWKDEIELLDYLHQFGQIESPANSPRIDIILLDLNMPCIDGREGLAEIKADSNLRRSPIVVLTTSKAEEDVLG